MSIKPRIRSTSSTERRCENMRAIIARLREGETILDDIAAILGYGPSGTRKYVKDLLEATVMHVDRYVDPSPCTQGTPIFRITEHAWIVDDFLAMLGTPHAARVTKKTPKQADPTRHIHLARDDAPFMPRLERDRPARRDWAVAAIFGDARVTP